MLRTGDILTDGSAELDAPERVVIQRDDDLDRMRFLCPNGHTRWEPTNNHVYCNSCSKFADPGDGPEYWEILDKKTGELVPWSAVELV